MPTGGGQGTYMARGGPIANCPRDVVGSKPEIRRIAIRRSYMPATFCGQELIVFEDVDSIHLLTVLWCA